jgi:Cu/Ag efflux pump CusA
VLVALVSGGISLGSLVGFLALVGIAARNGITLITHYEDLERLEGVPFGPDLVQRGTRERVAPIVMTAVTTAVALLPFAVLGNIAGLEIVRPMVFVILGGLVTSTWLALAVLPALYLRLGGGGRDIVDIEVPAAQSAVRA